MDTLYTYLLLGGVASCALGGFVGWWVRKQGEAARQHDVEVYYREALKISEAARDRAREDADKLGQRMREMREQEQTRENELQDLRSFLEGMQQAGSDTTERIRELEEEVVDLRGSLKERDTAINRLRKEWKSREAKIAASKNGHGELARVQAELKAMTEARSASGAEADRLRRHVKDLEARIRNAGTADGNGNGSRSRDARVIRAREKTPADELGREIASGNGAPNWLMSSANGDRDDLKSIHGLGPVLERGLNKLGVYYFRQLAELSSKDAEWLAPRLNIHPGRIVRGDWARQARDCHRRKYKEEL